MTCDSPARNSIPDRSLSFGAVAGAYDRFRSGPPAEAVEWLFPERVGTVVDVGAGTGALSRLLIPLASRVVAVDPDADMRRELLHLQPGLTVLDGRGEQIPMADGSADAVVASSSWHWVDPEEGTREAARLLKMGGLLATLWSGPDPEGWFMARAKEALAGGQGGSVLQGTVSGRFNPTFSLTIPAGAPFRDLEQKAFNWTMALTADDLVGLLGTLSWVIVLPEQERQDLLDTARRLLRDALGVEGTTTVDVDYSCTAYRCWRV